MSETLEEKRKRLKALLSGEGMPTKKVPSAVSSDSSTRRPAEIVDYADYSYDMFMNSMGEAPIEAERFSEWVKAASKDKVYAFESARLHGQRTEIEIEREDGERLQMLNFSSYNYLGFGYHPRVIQAAKDALDTYGLGAASSPVISGTFDLHKRLEQRLAQAYSGMAEKVAASLFSSGYGVNIGVVSAIIKPGNYVVLDQDAHMSLLDGARLSGGKIRYFRHNDPEHLRQVLEEIRNGQSRILVCIEGVYSAGGEFGKVAEIGKVAKEYGAQLLVDEAHSALLVGPEGLGVAADQDALELVDYLVLTFSKAFGGVGGAVIAREELACYLNWYARSRFFSCAIDPAVTAGVLEVLDLAISEEGERRRKRLHENAAHLRAQLRDHVTLCNSQSWVVPVLFGSETLTLRLNDFLQRQGLDTSIMAFPATPKNEARIRMFVTSEHTLEQCTRAAEIVIEAAQQFGFARKGTR